MLINDITLIVPYYNQPAMLERQCLEWAQYPTALSIIVVDDGSAESAEPVLMNYIRGSGIQLYRIKKDIPWNRGAARNLGTFCADTTWVLHLDIDHVLPASAANALLFETLDNKTMYRFQRFRKGPADETRNKDAIPRSQEYGEIKPHGDSYLCTRRRYWAAGGYNEAFAGCLGGGSPFLSYLEREGPIDVLRKPVLLEVYTRGTVADSSVTGLDRDTKEYSRRRRAFERAGTLKGRGKQFACDGQPWERVL